MTLTKERESGRPAVRGTRVRQAREIKGLTQEQLAQQLGVTQPMISMFEQEIEAPSPSHLEGIALATGFPTSFFALDPGPHFAEGSLLYRKRRKLSASDADKLRQGARLALELVQKLERRFKPLPVTLPRAGMGDPEKAAKIVRSSLGVSPDGPITGIVRRLERAGVLVLYVPFDVEGFDAFSAWSDEEVRRPVICLKPGVPGDRLRLTLAEELGHLAMHQDFLGAPRDLDREAKSFAGHLLIPRRDLEESLKMPITLTQLAEQKARWGVSMQAIMWLAQERHIITARQRRYVLSKLSKRGWMECEPVHIPVETTRLWRQMAESAFGAPVDYRRLAKHFDVSPAFVQALLEVNAPGDQQKIAPSSHSSRVLRFEPR